MAFSFETPENFEFRTGQFADFTLIEPAETDAEGDTRGFSLVHAPFEPNLVVATRMCDTVFKGCLKNLSVGAKVGLDGPYGDFTLHKTQATPAVFLIGGIGVTPAERKPTKPLSGGNGTGIDDFPLACPLCAGRRCSVAGLAGSHQVIDRMAVQDEIIRNDAAVASPPDGLRAHQC